ncbi:MAG: hypothetical protein AWT59_1799 [Candidatus Gallionella acididurans]|uniref:Uncharacterized protein n=1 Tax=Candidatus Gallionella acididurans TaxID=1796491 RepID=A0A139BSW6_9PROT|nr:MAG: hypothetical protein AWT59_1799 [Candidatus Gallionella acididurans]
MRAVHLLNAFPYPMTTSTKHMEYEQLRSDMNELKCEADQKGLLEMVHE